MSSSTLTSGMVERDTAPEFRDALVWDALQLADRLRGLDLDKNTFDKHVLPFLLEREPRWRKRLEELLATLASGAAGKRSQKLDLRLRRLHEPMAPLLNDRSRDDAEVRRLLGYTRWALGALVSERSALLQSLEQAPRPLSDREVAEAAKAKRLATSSPADRLKDKVSGKHEAPEMEQRDWLLTLPQKPDNAGTGWDLAELRRAVSEVFERAISNMRAIVAGEGPAVRKLAAVEADFAKAGPKAPKDLAKQREKRIKEADQERKQASRYAPFLAWLDATAP